MNTIAFVAAGVVLALIVLAKIPGLEHTVRPFIDLFFSGLKVMLENAFSWSIWLFKLLWDAHLEVFKHLMFKAEDIDPTVAIKAKSDSKD